MNSLVIHTYPSRSCKVLFSGIMRFLTSEVFQSSMVISQIRDPNKDTKMPLFWGTPKGTPYLGKPPRWGQRDSFDSYTLNVVHLSKARYFFGKDRCIGLLLCEASPNQAVSKNLSR